MIQAARRSWVIVLYFAARSFSGSKLPGWFLWPTINPKRI
jgi:hypothetical protein